MKGGCMKGSKYLLGMTQTGKEIYVNSDYSHFDAKDHMDAYRAYAKYITYNAICKLEWARHKRAMDLHYISAVQAEEAQAS